ATTDCAPCDSARQFLQRRGIPYRERRIAGDEDAQAFETALGARTVPALTIGAQRLRGWSEGDWSAYLDAAGYPRESRLPRGWQAPPATPLVAQRPAATPAPPAEAAPPLDAPTVAPAPAGLRF
ncbi:MAG: glutaredoxin family protein, partial [Comamonadaceae bacterium]|nr:glutaredoxin family protein [Comamonadaceae bacterium]